MNTSTHVLKNTNTEPHHDKTNEMASAPSEDSEQHGRMLRLICVFAWRTSDPLSDSSENIHIWTIGTLKGQLSFHDSSPQGPCPGVGLEVKTLDTFKKCFSTFLLWNQLMQIVGRTWLNLVTWTCGSWSEGQHGLYFQGPVILSYILKTILSMYIIPWEYESVWPDV